MTHSRIKIDSKVFYIGGDHETEILEQQADLLFRGTPYVTVIGIKRFPGDERLWLTFDNGDYRQWPHTMFEVYEEVDNPPKKKDNKDKGWGF